MTIPHNFYIHVPFCVAKCRYCAFYSRACENPDWGGYCDGILHELDYWYEKTGNMAIPTVFFGGGTPSLMPTDVFGKIMDTIATKFHIAADCEITLESNPGTIDRDRLAAFKSAGVNRLSVGVQSLDDAMLKFLGRGHSASDATRLIQTAKDMGLRVSADFIYGLPEQTVDDVKKMCADINDLELQHCSMYELTIEQGTPFATMNLQMPDNDEMAQMFEAVGHALNLPRYEVSNYAAPGQECRHNQNIWDGAPYIGFGRAAAGRVFIDDVWYEQLGGAALFKPMSDAERAIEKLITGLRTARGTSITDDIRNIINWDFVRGNPKLIEIKPDNRICATQKGLLILNDLLVNLTN